MTSACYPMIIQPAESGDLQSVYAATATDKVVNFNHREKILLYRALADTVKEFRDRIRIITPLSSLQALIGQGEVGCEQPYPCRGGIDYFFIDCRQGLTYPCGYRGGESLGHLWNLDIAAIDRKRECHACEWECFRDPSELFGPILEGFSNPVKLFGRYWRNQTIFRRWWLDLRYARACDYFDGRKPMVANQLQKFCRAERKGKELLSTCKLADSRILADHCPGKSFAGAEGTAG